MTATQLPDRAPPGTPIGRVSGDSPSDRLARLLDSTGDIRKDPDFVPDHRSVEEQIAAHARAGAEPSPSRSDAPAATTGARWISAIEPIEPPKPLVGPFMATYEATILYGPGGVGKGTTAAWMALEYLHADSNARVYILDFEHHEQEWSGRLRRLGAIDELDRIAYASPFSKEWTAPRGALTDVAQYVKADCDRLGVTLLIIDSYSAATTTGDAMGGQPAATEFFDALSLIGGRTLTLAHVAGNSQRWPPKPFGSVFVHNWARETWAIEQVETDGQIAENEYGLSYMTLELRCQKAQERERPRHQRLVFTFEPHFGAISAALVEVDRNKAELIHQSLSRTPTEYLTAEQIAQAVKADTGEILSAPQVYDAIRRNVRSRRPLFEMDETKRPFRYRTAQGA